MATRSRIGIVKENGTIESIYCHWDGYPSHNGRILLENYTDRSKVLELIGLGDLSSLGENVHPDPALPHTFDDPQDKVCVSYKRDRSEKGCDSKTHIHLVNLMSAAGEFCEFIYIFEGDRWIVTEMNLKKTEFLDKYFQD
jgi:hypothetical protein